MSARRSSRPHGGLLVDAPRGGRVGQGCVAASAALVRGAARAKRSARWRALARRVTGAWQTPRCHHGDRDL